ncbi:hypothetical protein LTS18_004639, partial [Coniosporium uncinatum]
MHESYQYSSLTSDQSIRILVLEPAESPSAPICCSLVEVDLDTEWEHDALSYCWQLEEPPGLICLGVGSGKEVTKPLTVGANCYAALQVLRQSARIRLLWVDAICIDQASNSEKSQQVRLMTQIYAQAKV